MRSDSHAKLKAQTTKQSANSGSRPAEGSSGGEAPVSGEELLPEKVQAHALAAQVESLPEIRKEKVAALRSAVEQGIYNLSNEQTAGALMTEMAAGARRRRSAGRKKPPQRPQPANSTVQRRDPHEGESTSQDFCLSTSGMELAADTGRGDCS